MRLKMMCKKLVKHLVKHLVKQIKVLYAWYNNLCMFEKIVKKH